MMMMHTRIIYAVDIAAPFQPLFGEGAAITVANGAEGQRRLEMYSRCFSPTAVTQYYCAYNQVTHFPDNSPFMSACFAPLAWA